MKKILYFLTVVALMTISASCSDDEWTTDPALEHVYYVGFYKTGAFSDKLNYEIAEDGTARWRIGDKGVWNETGKDGISSNIPIQLHSERVRSYDVVTFFWITNSEGSLTPGTDYVVIDEKGEALALTDGKYSLTWAQAKKGIQNVRIKRLSKSVGSLRINTLASKPVITEEEYLETTRNNVTDNYEVRGLSHDYNKETITFK